jgi:hypothetical protein
MAASCVPPKTGKLLDIAFSRVLPLIVGTCAASYGCLVLNKEMFNVPPLSLSPQFEAEAAKTSGAAQRLTAPAVYLNPIRSGLPGSVRGPEDVE